MIKVTSQLTDYSQPAQPSIKIHNHHINNGLIEIEIEEKRYVISGYDLIKAIRNAMNT